MTTDSPVIVGGHGGDGLRYGLVHVVEAGRLDGRQPVVVAAAAPAHRGTAAGRVRRCPGGRTDGRGRGGQRGRRTVLLIVSAASTASATAAAAASALVSQLFLASPLRPTVAEPDLWIKARVSVFIRTYYISSASVINNRVCV